MIDFKVFFITVMVSCILISVAAQQQSSNSSSLSQTARSIGSELLKRIGPAIIPGAFIIGAVTTLLAALTVVSMNGLGVGVVLLILTIGQMLSRTFGLSRSAPLAAQYSAPAAAPIPFAYSQNPPF
ncbi:hypothetical protein ACFFRR_002823 [Megaselia abdita]